MSLRELNRRRWIVIITAYFAWSCGHGDVVSADSPPVPARVTTLTPTAADQPVPVVTAIAIDPTGRWLAVAGDDKTIRIMQAGTFVQTAVLHGHRDLIRTVEFRHDGKILASSGNDGSLILWDQADSYKELRRVEGLTAVSCAKFSPDGKNIAAVGFATEVMMFGSATHRLEMHCDCNDLRACVFDSRGERLAVAGRSGHLHLFDPRSGVAINDYDLNVGRIRACEFTSDGDHMITVGEDGAAVLFDLKRAEVVRRVDLLPCKLFALARIDDKHVAVAGSDNRIRIVDFLNGRVVTHLDGHRGSISNLVYKNGSLFSGGFDATLRCWPLAGDAGARLAENEGSPLPPKETSSR